jgi:FtsZ-interacting cell division protein ZipA
VTTLEIVVIAVVVVFALLALAGAAANRRRRQADAPAFRAEIERANRDLAAAHAADNGWEPSRVAEAARTAFTAERPNDTIESLELVQVIDPPGTDDDKAVFNVVAGDGEHRLTLGRAGDSWHLENLD